MDNDKVKEKVQSKIKDEFGQKFAEEFNRISQKLRDETGFLSLSQTFKLISSSRNDILLEDKLHRLFHDFNFKSCLFNNAAKAIEYLNHLGKVYILTEGDKHYQLLKIKRSGIFKLVSGRVLIPQKEKLSYLNNYLTKHNYHTAYYIEDKPMILEKAKRSDKLKLIHICQGHYSLKCDLSQFDLTVKNIGDLLNYKFPL